jgi:O-antigen ligase
MIKSSRLPYINFISLLCALQIPFLVSGPFLPDLTLSLLSIYFFTFCIKNNYYKKFTNIYFILFLIFCLAIVISSILSDYASYSLKTSLTYIRIGIFSALISYLIDENKKILNYFYLSFFLTYSALIVDGYYQYFNKENLFGTPLYHPSRVSSFFGDELILGSFLSRTLPLFVALFIIKKKKLWEIYFFPIFLILISILIVFSGERASLLFLLISFLLILILISKYKKIKILFFTLFFLSFSILFASDNKISERFIKSPIESIGFEKNKINLFSPQHESLFLTARNIFLDKPIFGSGPRTFRLECKNPKYAQGIMPCQTHPHNFYFQILAETGLSGFLFLVGLFSYIVIILTKHFFIKIIKNNAILTDFQICLFVGLLITVWPFTTNGNFFSNYLMITYGLQMGFFRRNI